MRQLFLSLFVLTFYTYGHARPGLSGNSSSILDTIPKELLGQFTDDYDIQYSITDTLWIQRPNVKFHIIRWDWKEGFILARNDDGNPSEAGKYTRIDYVMLPNMKPWTWGFCLSVYDAASLELAEKKYAADKKNPKKGCNGFPFSRMKRITAQVQLASGSIERFENFSYAGVSPRTVDVYLPEGYSAQKRYAVLYMHDGQMLFDSMKTWNRQEWGVDETISRLLKDGKIRDCIVVAIWNSVQERFADYFPQKPLEALQNPFRDSLLHTALFPVSPRADAYLKFIVERLKPFIDSAYSTKADRENTVIAGSSMGGLISMYAICEYPKVFGGAACLSTHWPGVFDTINNPIPDAFLNYLEKTIPDPKTHRFYFDHGTATLDALYGGIQVRVDRIFNARGYGPSNLLSKSFPGEDHSEAAWRKRLYLPLEFLLTKSK